jgi:hypothetical protein
MTEKLSRKPLSLTIEQKFATGALLGFRHEFCAWIGIGVTSAYRELKAGNIKITKVGGKTMITPQDAIAARELFRSASQPQAA